MRGRGESGGFCWTLKHRDLNIIINLSLFLYFILQQHHSNNNAVKTPVCLTTLLANGNNGSLYMERQFRWPRRLKPRSADTRLLGSRVRIPLSAWMFVCCVCCVGSGHCDELITRSEESYRMCVCVCVCVIWKPKHWDSLGPTWAVEPRKKWNKYSGYYSVAYRRVFDCTILLINPTDILHFLYTWVRASWIEFNNCPTRCD